MRIFCSGPLLRTAAGHREFDTADDQSAVLAWRVEKIIEKAPELLAQPGGRLLQGLTDDQLAKLRTEAEAAARAAREAPAVEGRKPADHWTNRRHGRLTDAELERRIFTTRFSAREQSSINDPAPARRAHHQLRALQEEHRIRTRQLKESQRAAEAAERGSRTQYGKDEPAAAASSQRAWGQEVIAAHARAEERLRALTPRSFPVVEAPDRLPEWLAPSRAAASTYLPESWREELAARRQVLAARFEERGYLLAAEPRRGRRSSDQYRNGPTQPGSGGTPPRQLRCSVPGTTFPKRRPRPCRSGSETKTSDGSSTIRP